MKLSHYCLITLFFANMIISSEKNDTVTSDVNTFQSAVEIMSDPQSNHPNKSLITQEISSYVNAKSKKPYNKTIKKLKELLPESPFELKRKEPKKLKPVTIIQPALDPSTVPAIKTMEDDREKVNTIGYAFVTLTGFARITKDTHIQPFTVNMQPAVQQLQTNLSDYFAGNVSTPTTIESIKTNASEAQSKIKGLQVIQHGIREQKTQQLQPLAIATQLFLNTNTIKDESQVNLKAVLNRQFLTKLTSSQPNIEHPANIQPTNNSTQMSDQQFVNELIEYKKIAPESGESVDELLTVYYKKNPGNTTVQTDLKFL